MEGIKKKKKTKKDKLTSPLGMQKYHLHMYIYIHTLHYRHIISSDALQTMAMNVNGWGRGHRL